MYRNIILGSYIIIYRIRAEKIEEFRAFHGSRSPKIIKEVKKIKILLMKIYNLIAILFSSLLYCQESDKKNITFTQFEITVPLKGNDTYGEIDANGERSDYMLVPDGISSKFGYGMHYKKWLGLSIHSGIDWKITPKLVTVPVYSQLTINPKIGDETGILLQLGLGKSFAIGRGNLNGTYHKIRLGLSDSDLALFIDISSHGFQLKGNDMGSFSVGISVFSF